MTFGARLRQLRNDKNLTLRELENEMNISFSALGKYERDEREPDFDTLETIADYFNVSTDWLLGREESNDGYHHAVKIIDNTVKKLNPDAELYIPPAILNDMIEKNIDESHLSVIPVFAEVNGYLSLSEMNIIKYEFKYSHEMPEDTYFYIIAPDDSMKGANIVKDSKVLCCKINFTDKKTSETGKIYFVHYQNSLYIRRVFINEQDQITLQAENVRFPPMIVQDTSNFEIIGEIQSVEFNPNDI